MSKQGYKVLLDLVLSAEPRPVVREIPYRFRTRNAGESKLDSSIAVDYLLLLADKAFGHVVPARFILFAVVGSLGVAVHMAALTALMAAQIAFAVAQAVATLAAMTFNFFLNNVLTFRDKRLRGAAALARGLLSFWLVCSLGAFANVGVATILFGKDYSWWLSALCGIMVGVVWNYAMTSTFTWRR